MKTQILALGLVSMVASGAFASDVGLMARQLNDAFASVYEKVAPAVVVIEVQPNEDPRAARQAQGLDFFFRTPDGRRLEQRTEQGSGFIVSSDGIIITNNHVVEKGETGVITVRLRDGRKFTARLVGRDQRSDIAVLRIPATDLPTVELADSDAVRVGQFAFAIGAPFDLPYTFTVGVVSAKGRNNLTGGRGYEEYIQTDASINPGNSGGPLCDLDGRVVGVNTLISGMNRGLGFAVPSNIAKDVSEQILERGRVLRPWLGIEIVGLDENERRRKEFPDVERGVLVEGIQRNAPAFRSSLRPGDVIVKVDGTEVGFASELQREILRKEVGQVVNLDVWRAGRVVSVPVRTGEFPDALMQVSANPQPFPIPAPVPVPGVPDDFDPVPQIDSEDVLPPPRATPGGVGLIVEDVGQDGGVRVVDIVPGSPAQVAGFEPGDIITEIGGRTLTSAQEFEASIEAVDLTRGVMVLMERGGQRTFAILQK